MRSEQSLQQFVIFYTALGFFGLGWSPQGLTRVILPERSRDAVARRLAGTQAREARGDAPLPPFVAEAISLIRRYAQGEKVDFSPLPLDLEAAGTFDRAIYAAALQLGFGEVTTYGALAEEAGFEKIMARETGAALGRNPLPLVVPCHRILAAGGKIGGFSAPGGAATKQRMLAHEGVRLGPAEPAQSSFTF